MSRAGQQELSPRLASIPQPCRRPIADRPPRGLGPVLQFRATIVEMEAPWLARHLDKYRAETEFVGLAPLVEGLVLWAEPNPRAQDTLLCWLRENALGAQWIHHPIVGAVLEACASLRMPAIRELIVKLLAAPTVAESTALVAAQRLRLFPPLQPLWEAAAQGLLERLEQWEAEEAWAKVAIAMPSLAAVPQPRTACWLRERLLSGHKLSARAVAMTTLDWFSEKGRIGQDEARPLLLEAMLARLAKPGVEPRLHESLLWALGSLASADNLPTIVPVLTQAFADPQGCSDAAAVRAGRAIRFWVGPALAHQAFLTSFKDPALLGEYERALGESESGTH